MASAVQPVQYQPGVYPGSGQTLPGATITEPQAKGAFQGPGGVWMLPPPPPPGCPPGLEYLAHVDQLLVKQQIELLEAFTGFETGNKYEIYNTMGQKIYYAAEDTCCCGCCCGICCNPCKCYRKCQKQCCTNRSFDMSVFNNDKEKVMSIHRPLRASTCWCPCCLQKLTVECPPGTEIGKVRQKWSICHPEFNICDESGAAVLSIEGPICTWSCCGDVKFKVLASDGTQVGEVSKQWSGISKEHFTDADNFGITFPMDLDVKVKGTILGACFLIDYMFFEDAPGDKNKDAPGMAG